MTSPRKITKRSLKKAVNLPFLFAFTKFIMKYAIARRDAVSINIGIIKTYKMEDNPVVSIIRPKPHTEIAKIDAL